MTAPNRSMTSGQVGRALHLSQASIARYANDGRIPSDKTPGGHHRFNLAEVRAALEGKFEPALDPDVLLAELRELTKAVAHLTALIQAYADRPTEKEDPC